MNPDTDNANVATQPQTCAAITRRVFIKRTAATAVVTALALHAFRNEAFAQASGDSSGQAKEKETFYLKDAAFGLTYHRQVGSDGTANPTPPSEWLDHTKSPNPHVTYVWKPVNTEGFPKLSGIIDTGPDGNPPTMHYKISSTTITITYCEKK